MADLASCRNALGTWTQSLSREALGPEQLELQQSRPARILTKIPIPRAGAVPAD